MNILSRSKTEARKDAERIVEQLPPSFRKTNTQKPLVPSEISYTQTEAEERIFRLEKALVKAISERTELVEAIVEFVDSDRALVTTFKPTADLETRALRALTTLQDIAHKHRAALAAVGEGSDATTT